VKTATEWKAKATKEEYFFGSQCDFPIDKERVQRARLQQKNQSMEQLGEVIEEIRNLMLDSTEEKVSKRNMDERNHARVARMIHE
jgi:hypothetical protein